MGNKNSVTSKRDRRREGKTISGTALEFQAQAGNTQGQKPRGLQTADYYQMVAEKAPNEFIVNSRKPIKPRTKGQDNAFRMLNEDYDLSFLTGPAGSGKTIAAMAKAVESLNTYRADINDMTGYSAIHRILLAKPPVSMNGHSNGFIKGGQKEKEEPWVQAMLNELKDLMGDEYGPAMKDGRIQIVSFEYLRGLNYPNSFLVLDEAQNAHRKDFYAVTSRVAMYSKMIILGDLNPLQCDLPNVSDSGFHRFISAMEQNDMENIGVAHLSNDDIVRCPLVKRIISNTEKFEAAHANKPFPSHPVLENGAPKGARFDYLEDAAHRPANDYH